MTARVPVVLVTGLSGAGKASILRALDAAQGRVECVAGAFGGSR